LVIRMRMPRGLFFGFAHSLGERPPGGKRRAH